MYSKLILTFIIFNSVLTNITHAKTKEVPVCPGENATLKWNVSDLEHYTFVYWKKGQDVIGKVIPPNFMNMNPGYSIYINKTEGMVALRKSSVTVSDIGIYQCIVSFSKGKPDFNETQILSLKDPIDGCHVIKKNESQTCLTLHCNSTEKHVQIQGRFADRVSDNTYMLCNKEENETVDCANLPNYCSLCNANSSQQSNTTDDNGDSEVVNEAQAPFVIIIVGVGVGAVACVILVIVVMCFGFKKGRQARKETYFQVNSSSVTQPDHETL